MAKNKTDLETILKVTLKIRAKINIECLICNSTTFVVKVSFKKALMKQILVWMD